MNAALVDEWVEKAEEADYRGAVALNRRRKVPLPDLVCFHCPQCIDKYLKALIVHRGGSPPRIHDLVQLVRLCSSSDPAIFRYVPEARSLTGYAVAIRYPGPSATAGAARQALGTTRRLRRTMRRRLGL